jgi:hypothetical protein
MGLSVTGMCEQMRRYGTLGEIHECAQVIALMRLYAKRWRPWDPEGQRVGCRRGSQGARPENFRIPREVAPALPHSGSSQVEDALQPNT